ncbi:MAG: nitrilase-related carbon-nitrogen hydrolase, partial [Desulfobacterales bacterium]|nr:nitrilase-related carbon-nitrogen hydrolase [Desulfobacterales bacterium]
KLIWSLFDKADKSYQNPSVFGKLVFFEIGQTQVAEVEPTPRPTHIPVPEDAAYKQADLPVGDRVADLLERMTLEEKIGQMTLVEKGSIVEKDGDHLYNTSILLTPEGDLAARYRKIHLFGYRSEEAAILEAGQDVVVIDTPWGKSGLSTCYDLRFPELYRRMVDAGASFFLVASAWPLVRLEAWRLFNRCRAHENLAFLISCNCAGANQGKTYAGHSMMVDPWGQVLAEGAQDEELLHAEIDADQVDTVRQEFPALEDRKLS